MVEMVVVAVVVVGLFSAVVFVDMEAVGELEEEVEDGEEKTEEESPPEVLDIEGGDDEAGKFDDGSVDDKQEQAEGEDGEGEGKDNHEWLEETVEESNDERGEKGRPEVGNMDSRQEVGSKEDCQGHHHERGEESGDAAQFVAVAQGYFHRRTKLRPSLCLHG